MIISYHYPLMANYKFLMSCLPINSMLPRCPLLGSSGKNFINILAIIPHSYLQALLLCQYWGSERQVTPQFPPLAGSEENICQVPGTLYDHGPSLNLPITRTYVERNTGSPSGQSNSRLPSTGGSVRLVPVALDDRGIAPLAHYWGLLGMT